MSYMPIAPFGRSVDAALLQHQKATSADITGQSVNKYEVMRELTSARKLMDLSDRQLSVLQALLSFFPKADIGGDRASLVVFPSNAAICERMNGIPCSTMRRHLAGLVKAGLVIRRDSPNGKRYIKRYGSAPQAFGFDLTPLVVRFVEITELAAKARDADERIERLRRTTSLMRRDLAGLADYGMETRSELPIWDALSDLAILTARDLRRTLTIVELERIQERLEEALAKACNVLDEDLSTDLSTSQDQNEHHHQNSNKECDYESAETKSCEHRVRTNQQNQEIHSFIPLKLVTETCTEIAKYVSNEIRSWQGLRKAAETVFPMMGITQNIWMNAVRKMGAQQASTVVAVMLEKFNDIRSADGYLIALTTKAERGRFSCGAMIRALEKRSNA